MERTKPDSYLHHLERRVDECIVTFYSCGTITISETEIQDQKLTKTPTNSRQTILTSKSVQEKPEDGGSLHPAGLSFWRNRKNLTMAKVLRTMLVLLYLSVALLATMAEMKREIWFDDEEVVSNDKIAEEEFFRKGLGWWRGMDRHRGFIKGKGTAAPWPKSKSRTRGFPYVMPGHGTFQKWPGGRRTKPEPKKGDNPGNRAGPEEGANPSPCPDKGTNPAPRPKPKEGDHPGHRAGPEEGANPAPWPVPKEGDHPGNGAGPDEGANPAPQPEDGPSPRPEEVIKPGPGPEAAIQPVPSLEPNPVPPQGPNPVPPPVQGNEPAPVEQTNPKPQEGIFPRPEEVIKPEPPPEEGKPSPSLQEGSKPRPSERAYANPEEGNSPRPEEETKQGPDPDEEINPKPEEGTSPAPEAGIRPGSRERTNPPTERITMGGDQNRANPPEVIGISPGPDQGDKPLNLNKGSSSTSLPPEMETHLEPVHGLNTGRGSLP